MAQSSGWRARQQGSGSKDVLGWMWRRWWPGAGDSQPAVGSPGEGLRGRGPQRRTAGAEVERSGTRVASRGIGRTADSAGVARAGVLRWLRCGRCRQCGSRSAGHREPGRGVQGAGGVGHGAARWAPRRGRQSGWVEASGGLRRLQRAWLLAYSG
ncbi:hypothetical protein ABZP36_015159 [Zizania latifolia]